MIDRVRQPGLLATEADAILHDKVFRVVAPPAIVASDVAIAKFALWPSMKFVGASAAKMTAAPLLGSVGVLAGGAAVAIGVVCGAILTLEGISGHVEAGARQERRKAFLLAEDYARDLYLWNRLAIIDDDGWKDICPDRRQV